MPTDSAFVRLKEALAGEVRASESMARHTSFRIGGPAAIFAQLETVADVVAALDVLEAEGVAWVIVGRGSNLLVSDEGYEGAVLVLGREFKRHAHEGERLTVGAATQLSALVREAFNAGLTGLEWAVGVPGTLGGALAMNAGTRAGTVGDTVESATLFVPGEGMRLIRGSDVGWGYRSSGLAGRGIILEAVLRARPGDAAMIRASMERQLKERKSSQPLGSPSAGSVFVNPDGGSAGRLIESAGLKGLAIGGAQVSPVHANFIVNTGGATASDVVGLIRKVQMAVKDIHGIDLRPEIRFLGRFEGT